MAKESAIWKTEATMEEKSRKLNCKWMVYLHKLPGIISHFRQTALKTGCESNKTDSAKAEACTQASQHTQAQVCSAISALAFQPLARVQEMI